jgi:hypothetical protein
MMDKKGKLEERELNAEVAREVMDIRVQMNVGRSRIVMARMLSREIEVATGIPFPSALVASVRFHPQRKLFSNGCEKHSKTVI